MVSDRALQAESDRVTYPAMLPREIAVWRAWLALHQGEYDRFDYNVRVGPGYDPGPGVAQYVRDSAKASTRQRIDAVAYRGDSVLIVEVKDRAGLSALGQLLGYSTHYRRENPVSSPPKLLLVARDLAPGVAEALQAHGVPFEIVNPLSGP